MIQSILDQDLYTFTVGQAVMSKYPNAVVEYLFTNRRGTKFTSEFFDLLQSEIQKLSNLRLEPHERKFLEAKAPFLKPQYLDYLQNYAFDPSEVKPRLNEGNLEIEIKGKWHKTVFWEVPLLALISECYFKTIDTDWNIAEVKQSAKIKGNKLCTNGCKFSDFGTRRRRSSDVQEKVIEALKEFSEKGFAGTSNVYYAMKHDLIPIGTMSHQWIMGVSALESLRHANRYALNAWNDVYQGDLGIALTDTFGSEAFFEDFDGVLARLFDGVRHDSGDPFKFAERVVQFYKSIHIMPLTKTIVFSDSLNVDIAIKLKMHCNELGINCAFGIGTHLTNDFEGSLPLNMVIKLRNIAKNDISPLFPVVKLSDNAGKATGDADALRVARWIVNQTPLDHN